MTEVATDLRRTPLTGLFSRMDARMTGFAGYEMPLSMPAGTMEEHRACRQSAALFDVGHMGQIVVRARAGGPEAAAAALERMVPADLLGLAPGRQRLTVFTSGDGGILDDLMAARRADHWLLVVNAATKDADLRRIEAALGDTCAVTLLDDRALVALQGPAAETALAGLVDGPLPARFLDIADVPSRWGILWVARSGYTGEDGFEISVPADTAEGFAEALLARPEVAPAGLGARDSLRLEAGLCLMGADMDATTSPVEAGLGWTIGKPRRRGAAREGGFPGADRILAELAEGPTRRRVGLLPEGRAPLRAHADLYEAETGGTALGLITSGGFGPTLGRPVAMGYVPAAMAGPGTTLWGERRGKRLPVTVAGLPFVAPNQKR